MSEKRVKGIKADMCLSSASVHSLLLRLLAPPKMLLLPEQSSKEREQKDGRLRERKAGKERRRQQAREKEQQQAIVEGAGAGAMEPEPPPAEAMDDNKSMAVFLEWSDVLGYDNRTRFDAADDEDYASLPLSRDRKSVV